MSPSTRDATLFYTAVRDLDAQTILELLTKQEYLRLATNQRASYLLEAHSSGEIQLEEWELEYLGKVEKGEESGLVLFEGVDLGWRRYLAEQETDTKILASSLDLTSIRNTIRTYFSPSSNEDDSDGGGQNERVVEFGRMYEGIVDYWEKNGRPVDWAEKSGAGIEVEALRSLTLKVYRDTRKMIARVAWIRNKYRITSSQNSTQSGGSGPSRPPHDNSRDSFPTPAPSSDNDQSQSSRSSTRSPRHADVNGNGNGSSHTLGQESEVKGMSETKKGKRKRIEKEDGERDREDVAMEQIELEDTTMRDVEAVQRGGPSSAGGEKQDQAMELDELATKEDESSKRTTKSPPIKESTTLHPPRPTAATETRRRSPRLRTPSAIDTVQPLSHGTGTTTSPPERDPPLPPRHSPRPPSPTQLPSPPEPQADSQAAPVSFEASQFPQPLAKPIYLQRVSRSPSKERSASPFHNSSRRQSGLPAQLREAAKQNQSKLARFGKRTSEAHSETARSVTVERSVSVEQQEQVIVSGSENIAVGEASKDQERRTRENTEQVEEAPKEDGFKQLTSTPSGILMPPPPPRTSQADLPAQTSSGEVSPLPSSGAEPSTILSSPPPPYAHPGTITTKSTTVSVTIALPSSSYEEGEPSTQKSSQDFFFPTAAQPNTSRPNPHFPPTQDSPATSSAAAPAAPNIQSESQPESQSQSQSEESNNSSSAGPKSLPLDRVNNSSSESSSTSSYPRVLVPDTSNSTNADSHSSSASSAAAVPAPLVPTRPRALTPIPSISRASSKEPPHSDRKLRSSSRLSKSPAPPLPVPPKPTDTDLLPAIAQLGTNEENDSQAFQTQAPAPSSYYDAQEEESQALPLSASQGVKGFAHDDEEEEEEGEGEESQDSSGLTYLSHEEKARRDIAHQEKLRERQPVEEEDLYSQAEMSPQELDSFDQASRMSTVSPEKGGRYLAHRKSFGELDNAASGEKSDEEMLNLDEED